VDRTRLTSLPLPAYRHRLGVTPHPVTDPRGHSFGVREPAMRQAPWPDQWRDCELYLFGCDLFNLGFWWEAHEAWEAVWKALPRDSVQARFMQALIQIAAACLQVEAERVDGAARALQRAGTNLMPVMQELGRTGAKRYMGLDVAAWWGAVMGALGVPGGMRELRMELAEGS
jgi:uncharacterized protein